MNIYNILLVCLIALAITDLNYSIKVCNTSFKYFNEYNQSCLNIDEIVYDLDTVSTSSENSNNPNEDRLNFQKLNYIKNGYYLAIFDGHGGSFVSNYANDHFPLYLEDNYNKIEKLKENERLKEKEEYFKTVNFQTDLSEELMEKALRMTFDQIEKELYIILFDRYKKGDYNSVFVGSCALVIIVHNDKIIIANLGDSKAKLFRQSSSKSDDFNIIKLMNRHNSALPLEKEKLFQKFPNDADIVRCSGYNNKYCYVKESLQVTRAFGDFYLKFANFSNLKPFNGPYISSEPEITKLKFELNKDYLIVASDGMWDELSSNDALKIIKDYMILRKNAGNSKNNENPLSNKKLSDLLLIKSLEHAAKNARMTVEQLKNVYPGKKKRRLHDDISIISFIF